MRLQFHNYKKVGNIAISFDLFFRIFIVLTLSVLPSMGKSYKCLHYSISYVF